MSTTDPATTETEARIRASNDERTEVVEALQHALGEGRLDLAETETRVASAYSVRYRDELLPLLDDLPDVTAPSTLPARHASRAPSWAEIWRALVWRVRLLVLSGDAWAAPTARQCRVAGFAAAAAMVWVLLCALVGALAVSA